MPYSWSIGSQLAQFGSIEIGLNFIDSDGIMPFRRIDCKIKDFSALPALADSLKERVTKEWQDSQIAPPDPYVLMQQALDTYVGPNTYDTVRQVLAEFGFKQVKVGDIDLNVTAQAIEKQILPENAEEAVRTRIDSILGINKFLAVKGTLKAMGFGEVILVRNDKVSL